MKIRRIVFLLLSLLFFLFACTSEDSEETFENSLDKIEIVDFKILDNTQKGITVETQVKIESSNTVEIYDHGIFLLKNKDYFDKVSQGKLEDLYFTTKVSSGLNNGQSYSIFPYILAKNTFFYGDTLDFISKAEIDFEISEISPLQGFINDTILVKGKSLCLGTDANKNNLFLEENAQGLIFESDSLLKFLIRPNITKYKNAISIESCGLINNFDGVFEITPFEIDSLYPKEAYLKERVTLHGNYFEDELSEIWIDDIKVDIQKFASNKRKMEFNVPEGLPAGSLDLTLKMLDSTIIKRGFYQSTSPYVDSIDKTSTGFLDTLTVKGNYFIQPNNEVNIKIGNEEHNTFTATKEEIKIVLNRYFKVDNPKLELKIGEFLYETELTMLPPEILFIEDKNYHIKETSLTFKTKYYLPTLDNLKIGGLVVDYPSPGLPDVAPDGTIVVDPSKWLIRYYEKFEFDENGEISIQISTHYGDDQKSYKVVPPSIDNVYPYELYDGEKIEFNGLDFGHAQVSEIYLDNEILNINPLNDAKISFYTKNLSIGEHQLRIKTGSQESNTVTFQILPIQTTPFGSYTGTRNDKFSIYGSNLNRGSFTITANGVTIHSRQGSGGPPGFENRAEIQFPFDYILTDPVQNIKFHYADETKDLGVINAIEPYSKLESYEMPPFYDYTDMNNTYFEYNNMLYLLNSGGIYQFDVNLLTWSHYEDEMPIWTLGIGRTPPSIDGNFLYVTKDQGFHVYDMISKSWSRIELELEDNIFIRRDWGVVKDNLAYLITTNDDMIIYDLVNKTSTHVNIPANFNAPGNRLVKTNGNIYFDQSYRNIYRYDISMKTWVNLGTPVNRYGYDANLYEYNGVLYFSGGGEAQGNKILSAYDLSQNRWIEKVHMPISVYNHGVIGVGDSLYFCLGGMRLATKNEELFSYDINGDPNK